MYDITIFVLSDSIGETGSKLARASVAQFPDCSYEIKRYPYILSTSQIDDIFNEAKGIPAIIIYSTVVTEHIAHIEQLAKEFDIPTIDIMKKPLKAIAKILKENPVRESGILRKMDEAYFQTVDAIEFAVKYDDGKDPRGIRKADICLVGISRTSKTPLSMYLANKGYFVANVPLVPEAKLSDELYKKEKERIFGLTTNVETMMKIREERLIALGLPQNSLYSEVDRIEEEIEYADKIMKELGCDVIDVSSKAVEETASIIIETYEKRFGRR
ncbi:MAG: kinase/pyrophosphorylase [Firmicutes bacterium]|nr:kinase/pyrophosphorylase [Bacillota bacterium]